MMEAGKLNRRITIQAPAAGKDSEGIPNTGWTNVAANVWAEIRALKGREIFQAGAIDAKINTLIKIRYRPGITPAMRILYGSRVFNIRVPIDPEERHRELHLMCEELVAGG